MDDEHGREPCPICGETACVCERAIPIMGGPPKRILPASKGRGRGRGKDKTPLPPLTGMQDVTEQEDNFEKDYLPYTPLLRLARPVPSVSSDSGKADDWKPKDKKGKGKHVKIRPEDEEDDDVTVPKYAPLQRLEFPGPSDSVDEIKQKAAYERAKARRMARHFSDPRGLDEIDEEAKFSRTYAEDSDSENSDGAY